MKKNNNSKISLMSLIQSFTKRASEKELDPNLLFDIYEDCLNSFAIFRNTLKSFRKTIRDKFCPKYIGIEDKIHTVEDEALNRFYEVYSEYETFMNESKTKLDESCKNETLYDQIFAQDFDKMLYLRYLKS